MKTKIRKPDPRNHRIVLYDEFDEKPSRRRKRTLGEISKRSLPVKVELRPNGISICPKGYGDATSQDGYGSPILIEFWGGELRVVLWSNINEEDPTHTISMERARESNRQFCVKCGQRFEAHNSDGSCVKEPYGRGT